jgi:hypothetical protein
MGIYMSQSADVMPAHHVIVIVTFYYDFIFIARAEEVTAVGVLYNPTTRLPNQVYCTTSSMFNQALWE